MGVQFDSTVKKSDGRPSLSNYGAKSVVLTPKKKLMTLLLRAYIFFEGFVDNGWNHVGNVYYVVILGWSPFKASLVWFIRDITRMFVTAPAGAMVDKSEHKKIILCLIAVQKIAAGAIMVFSDSLTVHICKGVTDAITEAFGGPTLMAMTLGVVGKTRFHKKALAYNEMIKNAGTVTSTLIFGLTTFWLGKVRVQEAFYQFIAVGVILLLIVACMPSDVVDHNTSRGTSLLIAGTRRFSELLTWEDGDDDDEDDPLVREIETFNDNDADAKESSDATSKSKTYTKVLTLRMMYGDPVRGRSLFFLSFVILTFHLVHGAAFPLLGQIVGLGADDRYQISIFMVMMMGGKVAEFMCQWYLVGKIDQWGYRNCVIASCIMLGVHLIIVTVVIKLTENVWILILAHVTRAPSTALLSITIKLYVHLLSRRTGHFNLNFGVIETFHILGGALSIIITGALVTISSYQVTFFAMAIFTVIPTILNFGVNDVSLTSPFDDKSKQKSEKGTEHERVTFPIKAPQNHLLQTARKAEQ